MATELPALESNRLILREISYDDIDDMYEYAQLDIVGPMAGWEPHRNKTDTKMVIQMFKDKKKYGQLGVYAIILKEKNKMIGTAELHSYIRGFKAELGYTISPKYWGNGYAAEASLLLLEYGFFQLGLKRIEAGVFINNKQSIRVCEKLNMVFEGNKKNGYQLYDGSIHDIASYALTDSEFFDLYYGVLK